MRVSRLAMMLALLFSVFAGPAAAGESRIVAVNERVAVMPFIKGSKTDEATRTLAVPMGRFRYDASVVRGDADHALSETIQELLVARLGNRVVPLDRVWITYEGLPIDPETATPLEAALELGLDLGVEYVVVGNVGRFRERVGTAYAVQEPASVAFNLFLVGVESGRVVWHASVVETQRSLSEDLFRLPRFFRRGAKWLSVGELARDGMKEALKTFPLQASPAHPGTP